MTRSVPIDGYFPENAGRGLPIDRLILCHSGKDSRPSINSLEDVRELLDLDYS
jgi:hypothetical protein